ncbi:uncharacterized protein LY89DRAFT_357007 [Mollisia scopiformis]|uniref:Zn(2)-C6 fungal-type domain-containing protein n=1 Tax=Mollisia scopiformis TaxID=149040 RepID=A0A132B6N4_MOLSC|nr:uncharacterized protein LY89DRAFT_357007 [Mollisia scopiformis]KUJ07544.1 hypothetical protein LY89DRAFT_357007 [Mollisia scopiformis]
MNKPTAKPPRRQSCDRCHAQKLRCSRQGTGSGDRCTRCSRQNAECVYSTSLPKGRPSAHRLQLAGASAGAGNGNVKSSRSEGESRIKEGANGTENENGTASVSIATSTETTAIVDIGGHEIQAELDCITSSNTHGNDSDNITISLVQSPENLTPPSITERNRHYPPIPPPITTTWEREHGLLTAPFSSPGTNISFGDGDAGPWDSEPYYWSDWVGSDLSVSGRPLSALTPPSTSHGTSLAGHPCTDTVSPAAAAPTPNIFNPNSTSSNYDSHGHSAHSGHGRGDYGSIPTTQGCITQLSELLTRLSSAFAAAQQELIPGSPSLVINTAFDSLAALLVSPTVVLPGADQASDAVRDTFSASQRLLEILHHLQDLQLGEEGGKMDVDSPCLPAPPPTPPPRSPPSGEQFSQRTRSQHSDTVVHHLVLACHSLLLNIYGPLLAALQHDALASDSDGVLAPSLVDMRLILLVQLCSYFIDRLHEGVSGLCLQTTVDLEAEIQQKLLRLRRTLHI